MISHGILILLGVGITGGMITALLAQKLKAPQVLGYIVAGIILGKTGFNLITDSDVQSLEPFNNFALGIIGLLVGSELKFATLKKYAPQFSSLLLAEGLLAFILISITSGFITYSVTGNIGISASVGIVLGAIGSATDPASTISVLWENRAAGILTTTVIAIIALDDALALLLYGLASGASQILSGGNASITTELTKVTIDLGASFLLGTLAGIILIYVLKKTNKPEQSVATSFGIILSIIGLSVYLHLDVIIVTLMIGLLISNYEPLRSKEVIGFFKNISIPIYSIFFVLIGAQMALNSMPGWLWLIILTYVIARSLGKYLGIFLGGKISKSDPKVIKYGGLGIFSQGGVAIGLSIVAGHHFKTISITDGMLMSDLIVLTIATSTLFTQIIGPLAVKLAIKLADEENKDLTEEDIIETKLIENCLKTEDITEVSPEMNIRQFFKLLADSDTAILPVIDKKGKFHGTISLTDIKDLFLDESTWNWVLVADVLNHDDENLQAHSPLKDGIDLINQLHREQIPVLSDEKKYLGMLDRRFVRKYVRNEMLKLKNV